MSREQLFTDEVNFFLNRIDVNPSHTLLLELSLDYSVSLYEVIGSKGILQADSDALQFIVVTKKVQV